MGPFWHAAQLDELRWHWDGAYLISNPEPDVWVAQRRDNRETLRAASADELTVAIQADYAARPVPRGEATAGGES